MSIFRLLGITFFFLTFVPKAISQDTIKPRNNYNIWDKIYFGGNLGLQFGTITLFEASPLVGYKVSDKLSIGAGITYIYFKDNYYNYKTNVYGGRMFARYNILENIFLHGEYEVLNGQWDPFSNRRFNVTNIMAGGGYRQEIGANAFITLMVLWNFNESEFSPYANPIIRGGITFGF